MKSLILWVVFYSAPLWANIIGTEYQNFNPSITGLDFTTVHSSETLKPCLCNLGVFLNYAKNTLTYSDKYYQTNTDLKGKRANDYLIGGDLNLAIGLTNNWDIGVGLPYIVAANNEDPYGVAYFDKFGLTEIRPMTKFRFYGDDDGGLAIIFSANFNTIENNPFAGEKPGPTFNLELAGDTTTSGGYKLAANLGYRKRNSGQQITDPVTGDPAPFVPFKDSFIYSAALAKYFTDIKTDLIVELKGNSTGKLDEDDSIRKSQQALEAGLGFRHDWSKVLNLHGGLGTKLADAQSSPDIRVYFGLNYKFGPVCGVNKSDNDYPVAIVSQVPTGNSKKTNLNMPVTAKNIESYRWKIGPTSDTAKMDCTIEQGYSEEVTADQTIQTDIAQYADGPMTLCAVAKNNSGVWQPLANPSIYRWNKMTVAKPVGSIPHAIVYKHPSGISDQVDLEMPVSAQKPLEFQAYRWKIGPGSTTDCTVDQDYSAEVAGDIPIEASIGEIPDGDVTLCALAKNKFGMWQPINDPTIVKWKKKVGYELYRLNAAVLFDFDKDTLQKRAYGELEKISKHLKSKPFVKCVIEGHTDSMGKDEYNLDLSNRRANRVKDHLVQTYGFESATLFPIGKGERKPVFTNKTEKGRAKNRRVEFKIYRK